jgi:hypothetical protein
LREPGALTAVLNPYAFETVATTHWIVDEIPSETAALLRAHLGARGVSA